MEGRSTISAVVRNTISIGDGNRNIGSILTNPVDGTVLADTGPLPRGNYLFGGIVEGSVAVIIDMQHRDSTNTSNIDTVRIRLATAGTDYPLFPSKIVMAENERLRLVLSGGITGEVQGSIFFILVV